MPTARPPKLTERQDRFCKQFLTDANSTQAAIRAGYGRKGASVTAHRLLSNVKIQRRIAALARKRAERLEIKQDNIVHGLLREAMGTAPHDAVCKHCGIGPDTNSAARVRAWVAIATIQGMMTHNIHVQHGVSDELLRVFDSMADILHGYLGDRLPDFLADMERQGLHLAEAE